MSQIDIAATNGIGKHGFYTSVQGGASSSLSDDAGTHANPGGGYVFVSAFPSYFDEDKDGWDRLRGNQKTGLLVNQVKQESKPAIIDFSSVGDNQLVAAVPGKKIVVLCYFYTVESLVEFL